MLSTIHEIPAAFDENPTVDERVFLDISKAFDKVWHDRIFKLKAYSVKCELLSLLKIYLENREQRVRFNGQTSD